MSYYSREEQETLLLYDPIAGHWRVYSTYPPHIRKIIERVDDVTTVKDGEGRIIEVVGTASDEQVRLYKKP